MNELVPKNSKFINRLLQPINHEKSNKEHNFFNLYEKWTDQNYYHSN